MKKTAVFNVFVLFVYLMFPSCGGIDYSAEISQLDSLSTAVTKMEEAFKAVDTNRLREISIEASNNINRIKEVYTTDTVNMKEARMITTYKSLRKIDGKSRAERGKLWSEIAYSKKQLSTLTEDLKNSRFEKELGKKYFIDEKLATQSLLGSYESYRLNIEWAFQTYDSLHPLVLEVIARQEQVLESKK